MNYKVLLVKEAEKDILDIYNFVSKAESSSSSLSLIDRLEETCASLSKFPERGQIPQELEKIGVYQYRQVHYRCYRIIYEVIGQEVYILCVLDGRRNLPEILERRLLRPD